MILVVGGVYSGKRSYVVDALGFDSSDISADPASAAPVAIDVQDAVRSYRDEELIPLLLAKRVVVCNEVGCGIVPVDPAERAWRERVGRLCCDLAAQAEAVVRMSCGVPQVIKGEL